MTDEGLSRRNFLRLAAATTGAVVATQFPNIFSSQNEPQPASKSIKDRVAGLGVDENIRSDLVRKMDEMDRVSAIQARFNQRVAKFLEDGVDVVELYTKKFGSLGTAGEELFFIQYKPVIEEMESSLKSLSEKPDDALENEIFGIYNTAFRDQEPSGNFSLRDYLDIGSKNPSELPTKTTTRPYEDIPSNLSASERENMLPIVSHFVQNLKTIEPTTTVWWPTQGGAGHVLLSSPDGVQANLFVSEFEEDQLSVRSRSAIGHEIVGHGNDIVLNRYCYLFLEPEQIVEFYALREIALSDSLYGRVWPNLEQVIQQGRLASASEYNYTLGDFTSLFFQSIATWSSARMAGNEYLKWANPDNMLVDLTTLHVPRSEEVGDNEVVRGDLYFFLEQERTVLEGLAEKSLVLASALDYLNGIPEEQRGYISAYITNYNSSRDFPERTGFYEQLWRFLGQYSAYLVWKGDASINDMFTESEISQIKANAKYLMLSADSELFAENIGRTIVTREQNGGFHNPYSDYVDAVNAIRK